VKLDFSPVAKVDTENIVIIKFQIEILSSDDALKLNCSISAMFETKGIEKVELTTHSLILNNSPAIVFPYLRSFISTLTLQAGYAPITLPSYNFTKLTKA